MKSRNRTALPKRIETLKNVKIASISAGMAHTLALSGSGRVFSWGNNASGQLGLGHTMHLISPRLVSDLEFGNIVRTAKGDVSEAAEASSNTDGNHTSTTDSSDHSNNAQEENDEAMAKARSIQGALAPIHYPGSPQKKATQKATSSGTLAPKITSIHAAGSYSAVISSNGDIYTWGCGDANQLGHPPPPNDIEAAEAVSAQRHLTKGIRTRDIKSFDSRLNVLLPRRIECLNTLGLKAESIATGDNYLIAVCSKTNESQDEEETYAMGKTLYEIELEKKEKGLDRIRVVRSSG
jgi:alpha-tubulin suppressor-like RCC1 family protein